MTRTPSDISADLALAEPEGTGRRHRLREFQTKLMERMQAAASGTAVQSSQLGVMIGQTRWLLNLKEAGEIVSVGAITDVPLTQDWFLGVTNIRGNLVSVVDLARFRGMPATPVDKESRIVAFAPTLSFNGGLLVSRVLGLRSIAEMVLQDAADASDPHWASRRYLDRDGQLWTELDLSLIVQDPQFLHVGIYMSL